jgi:hypothetical protein
MADQDSIARSTPDRRVDSGAHGAGGTPREQRSRMLRIICCWLLIGVATPARADDPLSAGIELYNQGEFEAAVRSLDDALRTELRREQRARGYLHRGLAQALLNAWPDARGSFEQALRDDPEIRPDRERVAPPIAEAFDEVRRGLRSQLEVVSSTTAVVTVDGQPVGATPVVTAWPIGRHSVVVETTDQKLRFSREDVLFRADEPTRIVAILAPRFGALTVRSYPPGADVLIGGRMTGRTPLVRTMLPAGHAEVTVRMPGYTPSVTQVVVPAESEASVDTTLTLEPDATRESPPAYGPDLRATVDVWTLDVGMGVSGVVPLSSDVQTADPDRLGVSGGAGIHLELGISVVDLVQLVGVLAVDSFGPDLALYSEVLADAGARTEYVFDEGFSGALHARQLRLGAEARVTALRLDRLRVFAGLGLYLMPSVGSVVAVVPESASGAADPYAIRATLDASAWAPMVGAKWALWERLKAGGYLAVDLVMEARVEAVSWAAPVVEISAISEPSRTRAQATKARWDAALSDEGASVSATVVVAVVARL